MVRKILFPSMALSCILGHMNWLERHITLQVYDDRKAEMENAVTHFIGSALSLIGLVLVLMNLDAAKSSPVKAGMVIFALTNVLLYTASGLYHFLPAGNAKRICRILDHSNIYFLIAGTYTPLLLYVGTPRTIALTAFMWVVALLGVAFTLFFWGRLKPLHPILYLLMGWVIVFFWDDVVPFLPEGIMPYIVAGGVTYSLGVVFYAMKRLPHYHAIWHVFVLAGSIWFYVGIYGHLL